MVLFFINTDSLELNSGAPLCGSISHLFIVFIECRVEKYLFLLFRSDAHVGLFCLRYLFQGVNNQARCKD